MSTQDPPSKAPMITHPTNPHQVGMDTRAAMAAAIRAAQPGGVGAQTQPFAPGGTAPAASLAQPAQPAPGPARASAAPSAPSAPPVSPTAPASPAPAALTSPAAYDAEFAQQALADVIPLFTLPGSPEGAPPVAPADAEPPAAPSEGDAAGDPSSTSSTSSTRLPPERLQQIDEWASSLSPREWLILDGAMSGNIDVGLASSLLGVAPAPTAPTPPAPVAPPEVPFDPNAFSDPDLAAYVKSRLDQLDERSRVAESVAQRALENDQNALIRAHHDALNVAAARFGTAHELDAATVERVAMIADQLGVIGGLLNANPNAPLDQVYERALEVGLRSDDTLFNAQLEKLAADRAAELSRTQRESDEKSRTRNMKENAAAVSAIASRDLTRAPEPVNPLHLTEEQRLQAAAQMIRRARSAS